MNSSDVSSLHKFNDGIVLSPAVVLPEFPPNKQFKHSFKNKYISIKKKITQSIFQVQLMTHDGFMMVSTKNVNLVDFKTVLRHRQIHSFGKCPQKFSKTYYDDDF